MIRSYDLAIVGAGPAGSVMALLAARSGRSVCLIEKTRFEKFRFGETAPPELRPVLIRLGLNHLTGPPFCRDAPEVMSVWGSRMAVTHEHIRSPWGMGLHLDRRAFDEALAFAASDAGARLEIASARFLKRAGRGYDVELSNGNRLQCELAVIASGRSGGRAGLPLNRKYLDMNVAVAAIFTPTSSQTPLIQTLVESISSGWFYLATIPNGLMIAVFVTLAAFVPSSTQNRLHWWLSALARTRKARTVLDGYRIPATVTVLDARGSYAIPCSGDDWLAIGDARLAHDPLSGQGLLWTIDDACNSIDMMKCGYCPDVAAKLRTRADDDLRSYLRERVRVYRFESRFAKSPFWMENQQHTEIEMTR